MGLFHRTPAFLPPSPGERPRAGRKAPPVLCALALALAWTARAAASAILPAPAAELPDAGAFSLDARTVIAVPPGDTPAMASAHYLADLLERSRGLKLAIAETATPPSGAIALRRAGPSGEAYG